MRNVVIMNLKSLDVLFVKRLRVESYGTGGREGHYQTLGRERGYCQVRRLER